MKDFKSFEELLNKYIQVKEHIAVENDRAEAGFDKDIFDWESDVEWLCKIAKDYEISHFNINDDYDIDDIIEFCKYLENKVIIELEALIKVRYLYDKGD